MENSFDLASATSTLTLVDVQCPSPDESGKTSLSSPPHPKFSAHDEFWFKDGNLILVAKDVGFRVYRGLLCEQSTVFADMFAASSESDEETFDGCPIVYLSESPQELAHLFRILLPKSRRRLYPRKCDEKHTFDEVFALVRLSHKYHIEDVEAQGLDLLHQRYTDDFDQLDRGTVPVSTSSFHAIGAVNIARLTNTTSMLPLALYRCCNLGPTLLDGWKREDGHIEHLSVNDLKICFTARETLCKEGARIYYKIFQDQPSEECLRATKCRNALNAIVNSPMKHDLSVAIECSVLLTWGSIINKKVLNGDLDLCAQCTKELLARDKKARREAWNRFPDIFGITVPSWGKKVV